MIHKEILNKIKDYCKRKKLRLFLCEKDNEVITGIISNNNNVVYFQQGTFSDGLTFTTCYKANSQSGTGRVIAEQVFDMQHLDIASLLNSKPYGDEKYYDLETYLEDHKYMNYKETLL